MADRELMQQALEALGADDSKLWPSDKRTEAITALRERLAQPEPVQFKCTVVDDDHPDGVPLSKWGRHPDQEPFCYHDGRNIVGKEYADHSDVFPLYTAPQPRQWVGLTADEIWKCNKAKSGSAVEFHICYEHQNVEDFAESIEAKLKEKNHG